MILGSNESSPRVMLDLPRLLTSKLLLQANSGGGKSWTIRRLLEQTYGSVQQIVIDVEDEFYTLREKFDYVLARHDGGDCVPEVRSAELLATRLLELGVSAIVSIYELKPRERREFVRRFLDSLTNAPKALWHPLILVLDEAHEFCPEQGRGRDDSGGCADAVIGFMSKGRKRGFCGVLATQRISKLNKDAAAECNNKLIGRATIDVDRKRAAEELGFTSKEDTLSLRRLDPGEFFAFGPAISDDVIRFTVGPVATTHPKAGAAQTPVAPPKTKIKSVLAKLADLPQEAEQERATLEGLQREIVKLKGDLRNADAAAQAIRKLEGVAKPKPTKPIEVKVISALQLKRLESVAKAIVDAALKGDTVGRELLAVLAGAKTPDALRLVQERGTAFVRPSLKAQIEGAHSKIHVARSSPAAAPKVQAPAVDGDFRPNGPQTKILNTLASFEGMGLADADKSQVALFSGASPTSSTYGNNLSELRVAGLIDYPRSGRVKLTDGGRAIAVVEAVFHSVEELQATWIQKVGPTCGKIVRALIDIFPNSIDKVTLAGEVGASPTSSTYGNNLSTLRTLGLIDYPERGYVVATKLLFPPE